MSIFQLRKYGQQKKVITFLIISKMADFCRELCPEGANFAETWCSCTAKSQQELKTSKVGEQFRE